MTPYEEWIEKAEADFKGAEGIVPFRQGVRGSGIIE